MADVALSDDLSDYIPEWIKNKKIGKGFNWNDYSKWDDTIRVELLDGMVYMMSSPDEWHQWLVLHLGRQLEDFLSGRKCTAYIAPFDVRLFPKEDGSDNVVLQPDVFVVCDRDKVFGRKYCNGAPDFIIEVMSNSSRGRDLEDKKLWYAKAGVKEYWVISIDKLHIYKLGANGYDETVMDISSLSEMSVDILPGCVLKFDEMKNRYGI